MNTQNDFRAGIVSRITLVEENDEELSQSKIVANKELVELEGRISFFRLRDKWSHWIIRWITSLILFNVILTGLVGFGYLNYEKYVWLVPIVVGENSLQIIGMGYVVIKFLYPPSSK